MTLTASRIEKYRQQRATGLETLVDIVAIGSLIVSALVTVGLLMTFTLVGTVVAGCCLLGGFLLYVLLRCVAEHLRIQKKIAGCKYEGQITGPQEELVVACSNCGMILHSSSHCDGCGAEIVPRAEVTH